MSSPAVPRAASCAVSSLLADLLDASRLQRLPLVEAVRTRVSVHYETGIPAAPVISLCTPDAVRLPASMVCRVLPSGPVTLRDGMLTDARTTWTVARWWQPPRPQGLTPPVVSPALPRAVSSLAHLRPHELVGRGPGLTPSGDDVLAGVLVAAHATADPRLGGWRSQTRDALDARPTTVVSRALLHHALDGWATPELAGYVTEVCGGEDTGALGRLLAVGHSSGAALAAGVLQVLSTPATLRGAA